MSEAAATASRSGWHEEGELGGVALRRSGRGVRVAVVDTGVDATHPWFADARIAHLHVEKKGEGYVVVPDAGGDQSGHGTACAGIIHRMVPGAELTSVRALGPDGRCSRTALIDALAHCVRAGFHVVNLSLGIDVPRRVPLKPTDHRPILSLYEVADDAWTAGVVLVASGPNVAAFRTYPGRFKALIGVGRIGAESPGAAHPPPGAPPSAPPDRGPADAPPGPPGYAEGAEELERLATARTEDYEILAPGTDVLAPALGGGERRWTGTSFAAPFVNAHVARVLAARPGLPIESVKAALHQMAGAWEGRASVGAHHPAGVMEAS
ncbi:MAG: S8 family serine peptidase [Myxococcales bacterium]|nr:S8 family serine peptidase [Myxococcales bacterium]